MSSLRSLSSLFTRSDLVTIGVLVLLMVLSGLLEVFGIGMLFPYVAILQDPAKIAQSTYLSAIYRELGFESDRSFSIAMSGGLLAVFLAKGFFSLWMTNFQLRFIYAKQSELGQSLLNSISQPTLRVLSVREHVHPYRKFDHVGVTGLQRSYALGALIDRGGHRTRRSGDFSGLSQPGVLAVGDGFCQRALNYVFPASEAEHCAICLGERCEMEGYDPSQ